MTTNPVRLCPCPCKRPVPPGQTFAGRGCAFRAEQDPAQKKKGTPVKLRRPAVERGMPIGVVDTLIDVLGIPEEEIGDDALLVTDLGADSLDVVEIGMALEDRYRVDFGDQVLEWGSFTVGQVVKALRDAGAQL